MQAAEWCLCFEDKFTTVRVQYVILPHLNYSKILTQLDTPDTDVNNNKLITTLLHRCENHTKHLGIVKWPSILTVWGFHKFCDRAEGGFQGTTACLQSRLWTNHPPHIHDDQAARDARVVSTQFRNRQSME